MNRSLLFDSGCWLCSGLARGIATESDGQFQARGLQKLEMPTARRRAPPAQRREETRGIGPRANSTPLGTGQPRRQSDFSGIDRGSEQVPRRGQTPHLIADWRAQP